MASESSSSFGSHNPFRRKSSTTTAPHTEAPLSSTTTSSDFARALSSLPKTDAPPPPVSFARKKPVKKVRVQSPPPSSPESAGAEHPYPKYPLPPRDPDEESSNASVADEDVNGEKEDPFQNEAPPLPQEALTGVGGIPGLMGGMGGLGIHGPPQAQPYTGRGPPPNPFQKTLEDIEREVTEGGQADQASAGKAGMDVEAFQRLLLTGQGAARPSQAGDGASLTETASTSRQSVFEAAHQLQDTPRTSHEISEPEGDDDRRTLLPAPKPQRSGSRKKPPPPPATRHGRLIKTDTKDKDASAPPALERRTSSGGYMTGTSPTSPGRPSSSSSSPTDVNKPLPPPPAERTEDDAGDSIFDKEAAGKIPELDIDPDADLVPPPRPPTPPGASHSSSTPVQNPPTATSVQRKPAPPPRRQSSGAHGRSDSSAAVPVSEEATTPPRSSLESQRSRSSSIRLSLSAPAPPPPRRHPSGGHGHRQSPSFSSPGYDKYQNSNSTSLSSPSSAGLPPPTSPGSVGGDDAGPPKLSPPPPPPVRSASLRKAAPAARPPTKAGGTGAGGAAPPPPPPPRTRGSSKGSMDGVPGGLARTKSVDGAGNHVVAPVAEEGEGVVGGADGSDDAVRAMLADLEALQREVDAARAAAGGGG